MYSPTKIVTKVKSLTAKQIFSQVPSVKKQLWGGEFWSDGYFVSTVGEHANEDVIRQYIKNQGKSGKYKQLHKEKPSNLQLTMFKSVEYPAFAKRKSSLSETALRR